ncbi:hypothetical protein ALC56_04801 [Trachymyrmex septentrionalis]|uniref:Uncharacterized protein n=1 Tax=Trachymyrmex septentrionalis TaxID=34720 RepID=A0A151JYE9_9HYME|nr:hypothetical protein ALC56_04801 [Trachymyrmex septentrionalis]
MEGRRGSKKVGNWATFIPADPADLSKRRPLDSQQVKGPGGRMLVHVYSALLFWWIPEDPDPLKRRLLLSPTDQASSCWSPFFASRIDSARRFFLLQKDLTDLLEQRAVHGSAFASLVTSGYLGVATTAAEGATEGTTTAKGETTTATAATAATGRSVIAVTGGHRRLRQGEPCQTDNHTLQFFSERMIYMNDRSTDGFSRHRYRRLRGLSPIRASCPQFRLP